MINIIVAKAKNNVIGRDNDLPWKLPTDMKRFKELTTGHAVIMGRKCWESIPEKYRPLPNRTNVILTRNTEYMAEGATVKHSLQEALDFVNNHAEIFIIGGADIYREALPLTDKLILTEINSDVEGNVFLEGLDTSKWFLTSTTGPITENELTYYFNDYLSLDMATKLYGEATTQESNG